MLDSAIIRLAGHVELRDDDRRRAKFLLAPEQVIKLNDTGFGVLALCDGVRSFSEIMRVLEAQFQMTGSIRSDVESFLNQVADRGWIEVDET